MKLAFFALVLGLGTGACVADDPTPSAGRVVDGETTNFNVVNEVEIPNEGAQTGNFAVVTITGVEIPGRTLSTDHIDITDALQASKDLATREICAQADQLPSTDVCSLICNPTGIAAKLFDQGQTGECHSAKCGLPGEATVSFDVCVGN